MTVQRYKGLLGTLEKLIYSNIFWSGITYDCIYSILDTEDPLVKEFIDGCTLCAIKECAKHANDLDTALIVEIMQYGKMACSLLF